MSAHHFTPLKSHDGEHNQQSAVQHSVSLSVWGNDQEEAAGRDGENKNGISGEDYRHVF